MYGKCILIIHEHESFPRIVGPGSFPAGRGRIDSLVWRDGTAAAQRVARTVRVYRRAEFARHHRASRVEYRGKFICSKCAFKLWFAATDGDAGQVGWAFGDASSPRAS